MVVCSFSAHAQKVQDMLHLIKVPQGFEVSLYATEVENARSLTQGAAGVVYVGSRSAGKVYALVDTNGDGIADKKYTLAENLNQPNGVAYYKGDLYIAEVHRISVMRQIDEKLTNPPALEVIHANLPDKKQHGWRYIAFGPDDKLYISLGAPCNVCDKEDEDQRFATISRMNADGSGFEVFARGVRNSVGFDWHPQTKELWFTDNGRDWMGDNKPYDELNRAPVKGLHFGFPFCHAGYADPKFGKKRNCWEFEAPARNLNPHVAALGISFINQQVFPETYQNSIFIAEHGSWNKTVPDGYRITRVELKGNLAVSYQVFAHGWLTGAERIGRPVDVLELPDGSLLISDDYANCIYRISYKK